jgi:hypothetical protein
MKLTDKFTFGKYKGKSLKGVIFNDRYYIGWLLKNYKAFKMDKAAKEYFRPSGKEVKVDDKICAPPFDMKDIDKKPPKWFEKEYFKFDENR